MPNPAKKSLSRTLRQRGTNFSSFNPLCLYLLGESVLGPLVSSKLGTKSLKIRKKNILNKGRTDFSYLNHDMLKEESNAFIYFLSSILPFSSS